MISIEGLFKKLDQAFISSRRGFLANLGLLVGGGFLGGAKDAVTHASGDPAQTSSRKTEPLFEDSIQKEHDLVVVGGGISGVSAAISAARNGLDVALVHNRAMFGGNSSSEVKLYPENNPGHDPWIKTGGIHEEFHLEERVRNWDHYLEGTMNAHWDLVLYEWVVQEENITPYLNTHMHKAIMADDATIDAVFAVQLGTEKSYELSAPLFVDASGDGYLAYQAGADFRWGREGKEEYDEPLAPDESDEKVMGNTLFFTAVDTGKPVPFKRPEWAAEFETEEDLYARGHDFRGHDLTNGGYWWIEIGAPYHPIKDNNAARHEGLRQLLGVWDHIKNKGEHGAETLGLQFAGFWPYKRESRRVLGDYVVTQHDVQNPQQLDDAVAYGCWHIDIHVQGGILARNKRPYPPGGRNVNWQDLGTMVYGIPLRSLYSRNVRNLMMAGRPISCSYLAFASSRVLSTGSICGQAVGAAAAVANKHGVTPREVAERHASECQQVILRQDGHIPGVANEDPDDLARSATATASSESAMVFPDPQGERELSYPHAQLFPVSENHVESIDLLLRSDRDRATELRLGLREAPHVWDFRSEDDLAVARATIPPGHDGWVSFDFDADVEPERLYYIYTDQHDGIYWKSYRDVSSEPSRVPIGTTPAYLPPKTSYEEKSTTYKEIYSPTELTDIPGAGREGHWKPLTGGRSMVMKITPQSRPYGAANVNQGTNRPDRWSNIWISDASEPLPAWLQLRWNSPQEFDTVQLTFDTNQNYRVTEPLYRYPESVRDYALEHRVDGEWKEILTVQDNYMRRRVHRFEQVQADRLRIRVMATNGIDTAHIYEVRVYDEGT